mmetsp:Transcript_77420/g.153730  ORF Transcript_77420/g.153730 Transcript_77420/m.153730 type:complete len:254 (+) Transcript_77420:1004-1765(+)
MSDSALGASAVSLSCLLSLISVWVVSVCFSCLSSTMSTTSTLLCSFCLSSAITTSSPGVPITSVCFSCLLSMVPATLTLLCSSCLSSAIATSSSVTAICSASASPSPSPLPLGDELPELSLLSSTRSTSLLAWSCSFTASSEVGGWFSLTMNGLVCWACTYSRSIRSSLRRRTLRSVEKLSLIRRSRSASISLPSRRATSPITRLWLCSTVSRAIGRGVDLEPRRCSRFLIFLMYPSTSFFTYSDPGCCLWRT